MRGCSVRREARPPYRWVATCSLCSEMCAGEGFCPGDAVSALPCRSERRMRLSGCRIPDWKEMLRDAETIV